MMSKKEVRSYCAIASFYDEKLGMPSYIKFQFTEGSDIERLKSSYEDYLKIQPPTLI